MFTIALGLFNLLIFIGIWGIISLIENKRGDFIEDENYGEYARSKIFYCKTIVLMLFSPLATYIEYICYRSLKGIKFIDWFETNVFWLTILYLIVIVSLVVAVFFLLNIKQRMFERQERIEDMLKKQNGNDLKDTQKSDKNNT